MIDNKELFHHGVKGQKWGVRRFQNKDGKKNHKVSKIEQAMSKRYIENKRNQFGVKRHAKEYQSYKSEHEKLKKMSIDDYREYSGLLNDSSVAVKSSYKYDVKWSGDKARKAEAFLKHCPAMEYRFDQIDVSSTRYRDVKKQVNKYVNDMINDSIREMK